MDRPTAERVGARWSFTVSTSLGDVAVWPRHGEPDARAVLPHANPGDSRDFDAVAAVPVDRHRSEPGHRGGARRSGGEVLAARGIGRVSVIGNSVGGHVAARPAQRDAATIAGVVLVDPGGFTPRNLVTQSFRVQVTGRQRLARLLVAPLARVPGQDAHRERPSHL